MTRPGAVGRRRTTGRGATVAARGERVRYWRRPTTDESKTMSNDSDLTDVELSDAELVEVLKNHGIDRRLLMKVVGAGGIASLLGGTASANPGRGTRIDDVFGAPYAEDDTVPSGIVDHVVDLNVLFGEGEHAGFPMGEEEEQPYEFIFDPVGVHVTPGDVVQFRNLIHEHTVTSFKEKYGSEFLPLPNRVPDDVSGFSSPVFVGGESWLYRFTEQGVYDLFCFPHLFLGMVMRVVVSDPNGRSLDGEEYDRLQIPNAGAVLADPALDPENVVEDGSVAWADLDL